jgi:hypothetical protein
MQVEALLRLGRPSEAKRALEEAAERCPGFGESEEHQSLLGQVGRMAAKV